LPETAVTHPGGVRAVAQSVEVAIPQPPGVTAKRLDSKRILITYKIGGGDD